MDGCVGVWSCWWGRVVVDGRMVEVDGTVRGGRFVMDGSWWTVRGGQFVVDGSWWTVRGRQFIAVIPLFEHSFVPPSYRLQAKLFCPRPDHCPYRRP